jgi:histidinol-phosphatase (PHP family)
MFKFDCHIHTPLCGHARGEPKEYVDAAVAGGLSLITFTCHIPMSGPAFNQEGTRMAHGDLQKYRKQVAEAAAYGEGLGVEVLCGIEAEIGPSNPALVEMETLLKEEAFDFVLGSLHHMLPGFRRWLDENNKVSDRDRVEAYFEVLGEGALSGMYHSIAHPDVIRIYNTLDGPFDPAAHRDVIERFLDKVKESGVCLEINSSGLIKGDYVAHPDPMILEWAVAREIPFTFGSDSHLPDRVGHYFEESVEALRALGASELNYFRDGQRIRVALDEVRPLST